MAGDIAEKLRSQSGMLHIPSELVWDLPHMVRQAVWNGVWPRADGDWRWQLAHVEGDLASSRRPLNTFLAMGLGGKDRRIVPASAKRLITAVKGDAGLYRRLCACVCNEFERTRNPAFAGVRVASWLILHAEAHRGGVMGSAAAAAAAASLPKDPLGPLIIELDRAVNAPPGAAGAVSTPAPTLAALPTVSSSGSLAGFPPNAPLGRLSSGSAGASGTAGTPSASESGGSAWDGVLRIVRTLVRPPVRIDPTKVVEATRRVAASLYGFAAKDLKNAHGPSFLEPVSKLYPALAAQYAATIQKPIDLGGIKHKASTGKYYKTLDDLRADVRLLRDNCRAFNGSVPSSAPIVEAAEAIAAHCEALIAKEVAMLSGFSNPSASSGGGAAGSSSALDEPGAHLQLAMALADPYVTRAAVAAVVRGVSPAVKAGTSLVSDPATSAPLAVLALGDLAHCRTLAAAPAPDGGASSESQHHITAEHVLEMLRGGLPSGGAPSPANPSGVAIPPQLEAVCRCLQNLMLEAILKASGSAPTPGAATGSVPSSLQPVASLGSFAALAGAGGGDGAPGDTPRSASGSDADGGAAGPGAGASTPGGQAPVHSAPANEPSALDGLRRALVSAAPHSRSAHALAATFTATACLMSSASHLFVPPSHPLSSAGQRFLALAALATSSSDHVDVTSIVTLGAAVQKYLTSAASSGALGGSGASVAASDDDSRSERSVPATAVSGGASTTAGGGQLAPLTTRSVASFHVDGGAGGGGGSVSASSPHAPAGSPAPLAQALTGRAREFMRLSLDAVFLGPLRRVQAHSSSSKPGAPPAAWVVGTVHAQLAEAVHSLASAGVMDSAMAVSTVSDALQLLKPSGPQADAPTAIAHAIGYFLSPEAVALAGLGRAALTWTHPLFATARALYTRVLLAHASPARLEEISSTVGIQIVPPRDHDGARGARAGRALHDAMDVEGDAGAGAAAGRVLALELATPIAT